LVCRSTSNRQKIIENLFFPTNVIAVNIVWLPDGSKLTKVIISTSDKIEPQQHLNIEKVKQIAKQIRNIELLVESENPN
jgi:transcription antitermination factor NusA-like protein